MLLFSRDWVFKRVAHVPCDNTTGSTKFAYYVEDGFFSLLTGSFGKPHVADLRHSWQYRRVITVNSIIINLSLILLDWVRCFFPKCKDCFPYPLQIDWKMTWQPTDEYLSVGHRKTQYEQCVRVYMPLMARQPEKVPQQSASKRARKFSRHRIFATFRWSHSRQPVRSHRTWEKNLDKKSDVNKGPETTATVVFALISQKNCCISSADSEWIVLIPYLSFHHVQAF